MFTFLKVYLTPEIRDIVSSNYHSSSHSSKFVHRSSVGYSVAQ